MSMVWVEARLKMNQKLKYFWNHMHIRKVETNRKLQIFPKLIKLISRGRGPGGKSLPEHNHTKHRKGYRGKLTSPFPKEVLTVPYVQ